MTQHTPGPWTWIKVDSTPDRQGWLNSPNESVMFVPNARGSAAEIAIRDADARLIAAAPDLLAALEGLTATARTFRNVPTEDQEWTPIDDEALDAAFAVIDKARGIGQNLDVTA